jgi:kynurenine formamidase
MGKKIMIDLTHPFSADIPRWPYFAKPVIDSMHTLAKGGVLTQRIDCVQHTGTHCDAPRHVMEKEFDGKRARYTHEMPVDAYTGEAVCLEIDIEPWGLITDIHLDAACKKANIKPEELEGMIVCLNTGMHRKFDDSKEYYHYSCGTGMDAGKWFVKNKVKCVAMDMQALDHPLHTAMGNNGGTCMNLMGASGRPITTEYKEQFGEEAYAEFDKEEYIRIHGQEAYDKKFGELEAIGEWGTWEPCHKMMLGHGIVGVENLGGDLDKVSGKRFRFFCFPIRWYMGDGAMVRCVAEIDEDDVNDVPDRTYTYGSI